MVSQKSPPEESVTNRNGQKHGTYSKHKHGATPPPCGGGARGALVGGQRPVKPPTFGQLELNANKAIGRYQLWVETVNFCITKRFYSEILLLETG